MGGGRALLSTGLALAALLLTASAAAQRVILVRAPAPDEVLAEAFTRLRAELELSGFDVALMDLDSNASLPAELSELARRQNAFAAISLTRHDGTAAADVCVADRVTGKASLRTLALSPDQDAPSVLAVRASDLLRASLREFGPEEGPPVDVVGVDAESMPEPVRRWTRQPARFRLDVRAAALGVAQRVGAGYGPSLGFSYRVVGSVWVGVSAVAPAFGASLESELGTAELRQALALARLTLSVLESSRFELRPSIVVGVYHLTADGEVDDPLVAQSDSVTSFAGGAAVEAGVVLGGPVKLVAELGGLWLAPRPAVALLDDQYAFALPFVTASFGIGVEF